MANPVKKWVKDKNSTIRRSLSSTSSAQPAVAGGRAVYAAGAAAAAGSYNKSWVHQPDVLVYGHVEYGVKFFGECRVSQPKGQQVIKDAIHKLRFRLDETRLTQGAQATKLPKTQLHISVDSVTVVDAKTKAVMYKYPLHRISFCADDKEDKRVFSFIAKRPNSEEHDCFVFLSEKLAEEITLTIGQAFDLAYRKFLERDGRDLEYQKQIYQLRQRVQQLTEENTQLKQQLGLPVRLNPAEPNSKAWQTFSKISATAGGEALDGGTSGSGGPPPQLPTTPMPTKPPASLVPLPPPAHTTARRRLNSQPAKPDLTASAAAPESVFDNDFDPRGNGSGEQDKFNEIADQFPPAAAFENGANSGTDAVYNNAEATVANGTATETAGGPSTSAGQQPTTNPSSSMMDPPNPAPSTSKSDPFDDQFFTERLHPTSIGERDSMETRIIGMHSTESPLRDSMETRIIGMHSTESPLRDSMETRIIGMHSTESPLRDSMETRIIGMHSTESPLRDSMETRIIGMHSTESPLRDSMETRIIGMHSTESPLRDSMETRIIGMHSTESPLRDSIAMPDNATVDFDAHVAEMRAAFAAGMTRGDTGTIDRGLLSQFDPLAAAESK